MFGQTVLKTGCTGKNYIADRNGQHANFWNNFLSECPVICGAKKESEKEECQMPQESNSRELYGLKD